MKRHLAVLLAVLFLVGCSSGTAERVSPPPETTAPAPETAAPSPVPVPDPPRAADPAPRPTLATLKPGTWVEGTAVGPTLGYLATKSPDEHWWAEVAGEAIGMHSLIISPADRSKAWVVEPQYTAYGDTRPQWTDRNTLIYYSQYGGEHSDSWFEVDPATEKITPFLPEILKGQSAGRIRFSPDGKRLLASTGFCNGCNKPSEVAVTTYLVDLSTGTAAELGVDVDAQWEGDQVKLVTEEPHFGYSGPIFYYPNNELRRPIAEEIQIGGTDYVEWRAYRLDAQPGEAPFKVIPAMDRSDTYNSWKIWWPDPPPEPFRLEAWALVRQGVPDKPQKQVGRLYTEELRVEGGKRWAVVYSLEIKLTSDDPPKLTVWLDSLHMWDAQNGWGVDWAGRILRTGDGGNTWRDVTPAGFDRCIGAYAPRYAREFGPGTATVAMACDRTGPDGKWTRDSARVSIFRSTDGGKTWAASSIETEYRFAEPLSLQFVDKQNGWAVVRPRQVRFNPDGEGALYRTADGGRTWQKATDSASGLPAAIEISFLDPKRGWAVGPRWASLHMTEDGGTTWSQVPAKSELGWFSRPDFLTQREGYFAAGGFDKEKQRGYRQLYWTQDGGRTWEKRSEWLGESRPIFLSPEVGYTTEYETIKWTRDGGWTWESVPSNTKNATQLHFVDDRHGFSAGGLIKTTADGGETWTEVYPQGGK